MCDVSGAFLKAYMDDFVVVVFENEMVDLLIQTVPSYADFVHVTRDGGKNLFVKLRKAMYGCLKAARLWWEEFSKFRTETMGFRLNIYDSCVANKDIKGSQCTLIWHVDDLKISHKDESVVREIIQKIEEKYGEMSTNYGSKHTYVGMEFNYNRDGSVSIGMEDYLKDAIDEFPDPLTRNASTPASPYLFEVSNTTSKLNEEKAKVFHRIVAMLLFVSKRGRPDIQVAIAFLSTRTTKSDEDDWKKLQRVLCYLKGILHLRLRLSCDEGTPIIKWWVDASYAVHHDLKSHSGAILSLGSGCVYSKSSKQKINAKSSTEAELIAASDMSSQILWTLYFFGGARIPCH